LNIWRKLFPPREWFVLLRFREPVYHSVWLQARPGKGFTSEAKAKTWAGEFVRFSHHKFDTLYDYKIRREPNDRRRNRAR
jgi:hypothetical protein